MCAKKDNLINIAAVQPPKPRFCVPFASDTNLKSIADTANKNLERTMGLIDQAAGRGAKVVCTPENVTGVGVWADEDGSLFRASVKSINSEALDRFCEQANRLGIYTIACLYLAEGNDIYNCGVLIGPNGKIMGTYKKTHLPASERHHITAGNEYPVFETEFGRVGILICYDMHFPEPVRCLALNGADIVFHPTIGLSFGGGPNLMLDRVKVRAFDSAVWIVVAHNADINGLGKWWCGSSMIVNPLGEIIADAGTAKDTIVMANIDPKGGRDLELDYSHSGVLDWRKRMNAERCPDSYSVLSDNSPPVCKEGGKVIFKKPEEIAELTKQEAANGRFEYCRQEW